MSASPRGKAGPAARQSQAVGPNVASGIPRWRSGGYRGWGPNSPSGASPYGFTPALAVRSVADRQQVVFQDRREGANRGPHAERNTRVEGARHAQYRRPAHDSKECKHEQYGNVPVVGRVGLRRFPPSLRTRPDQRFDFRMAVCELIDQRFRRRDPVLLLAWAGQWTCPGKPVGLYGPLDPPERAGPACTWSPCEHLSTWEHVGLDNDQSHSQRPSRPLRGNE